MKTLERKLNILITERYLLRQYLKDIKGNKRIIGKIMLMLRNTDIMIK